MQIEKNVLINALTV